MVSVSSALLTGVVLFTSLAFAVSEPETSPKPKYGPQAVPLSASHGYVKKAAAPDFWALSPYYLPQKTGSACSSASVAIVMNGLRAGQALTADDELVSEELLLKRVGNRDWTARVGQGGLLNRSLARGVTLEMLGRFTEQSLKAFQIPEGVVEVVHVAMADSAAIAAFQKVLAENEKSSKDFLIVNMDQSRLTGDPGGGGHISPIGAYDAGSGRVLVMDVDRQWYEPYWVPVKTLVEAMATLDPESKKNRGYIRVQRGGK